MKKNLPVTQREIDYTESDVFITRTDTKGVITYANDSFVKISGFPRDELIGKNHNIVRHPDMPEWAFAELWKTVQSGHPWRGLVKNRAKNGDHYWVRATISPIIENGNVAGYLSLRKKPERKEVTDVEALYKAEKAPSPRYYLLQKFRNFSLQTKLQMLIQPMLLILLGLANVIIYNKFSSNMMDSARSRAQAAAMQVIDSANMMMISGTISDTDNRKLLIKKIIEGQQLKTLKLIRTEQVVKQYGPGLPEESLSDPLVRQTIENSVKEGRSIPYFSLEKRNGIPVFKAITPYMVLRDFHGTDCSSCHRAPIGSANGASDIEIDMSMDFDHLNKVMAGLIVGQIALQTLLFFFVWWLVTRFVEKPVNEIKAHLNDVVCGNMSVQVDISGRDEMGEILCSVQSTKVLLGAIIDQIISVSSHFDDRSKDLKETMSKMGQSSQIQLEAASSMAAAIEEMTASIDQVAENAGEVQRVSDISKAKADDGKKIVQQVVGDMSAIQHVVMNAAQTIQNLGAQSDQIQNIVKVIKEIADQTNLLALNAAIEAARAGEQGRGFAVVADEVRNLAERTAKSTQKIDEMVKEIRRGTENAISGMESTVDMVKSGAALAENAGVSIVEIDGGAFQVLNGVRDISSSIKEQSLASREISVNVEKVAQMSEENSDSVRQVSNAVENLEKLSSELNRSVSHFRI